MQQHSPRIALAAGLTLPLCFLAALFEGIDLQSAGIAMPKMAAAFLLDTTAKSWVLSASTLGLLIGALLGGRLADYVGRKRVLVGSMIAFGVFSLGTTLATTTPVLLAMRLLTGAGLGGAMPNMLALVAENADPKRRGFALAAMYCGMPLGGALISLISFLSTGDWRVVFWVGGVAPVLAAPVLGWWLPESRGYRALAAREPLDIAHALFGGGRARATLAVWIAFGLTLLVLYLLLNWLPSLLVARGLGKPEAAAVQVAFNIGGALGALLVGALMDQPRRALTVFATYLAMVFSLVWLANAASSLLPLAAAGCAAGATTVGAQAIVYAIVPLCYETAYRGTGVGAAVAAGRVGSVLGPLLAGLLLGAGRSPGQVLLNMVPVLVLAGLAALLLVRLER
ncbi:MAG TPA: 3-(3-hydroxy-phenyl)propionate transporter MhpT [Steroidobacteraceae bacterium]|nr:3-(3-hydroxy-phenyl)propionate transporter MhpT [Steroidobacteraceae bacterium]